MRKEHLLRIAFTYCYPFLAFTSFFSTTFHEGEGAEMPTFREIVFGFEDDCDPRASLRDMDRDEFNPDLWDVKRGPQSKFNKGRSIKSKPRIRRSSKAGHILYRD